MGRTGTQCTVQSLGANERKLESLMNLMTLVSISYSDSNLMYLNWAVNLPAYFARHFTGIVFRQQNAILVDSIDFVLECKFQPLASAKCEQRTW